MENKNFYVVHGWMINELKLSKTDLIVYAIIYGFSQDGDCVYNGSRSYLAECANVSVTTIDNVLHNLIKNRNIEKFSKEVNGITFNSYKAIVPEFGGYTNFLGGSITTCNNNKDKNNNISKDILLQKNKKKNERFEEFWDKYGYKKSKNNALLAWQKLSEQDKENAINAIQAYKADCEHCNRQMLYPERYIKRMTWEDDFCQKPQQQAVNNTYPRTPDDVQEDDIQPYYDYWVYWHEKKIYEIHNIFTEGIFINDVEYQSVINHIKGEWREKLKRMAYAQLDIQRAAYKGSYITSNFSQTLINYFKEHGWYEE